MKKEDIKYILVKNNCALMECYMGGQLAYFFTDKSDGTYYNTLDRGCFDCWTVMLNYKKNAKMVLATIKKAWKTKDHIIEWDEEECTSMNEDPEGTKIVKVQHISDGDNSRWVVCEDCK